MRITTSFDSSATIYFLSNETLARPAGSWVRGATEPNAYYPRLRWTRRVRLTSAISVSSGEVLP